MKRDSFMPSVAPTTAQLTQLRERLTTVLELAMHGDERLRHGCAARLHTELTEWGQEVLGRTTLHTLTADQIQRLRRERPGSAFVMDAALAGNRKALEQCLEWIIEREDSDAPSTLRSAP